VTGRSLGSALLLALAATAPALATDWVQYYHDHVRDFAASNAHLDPASKNVVLVGDSLTEGFSSPLRVRYLPTLAPRTLNRGISSDGVGVNSRGVLHRLNESVFDCHPSHVILGIGVNDIGTTGTGIARAATCLRQVIDEIRQGAPGVVLILEAAGPARGNYDNFNAALHRWNQQVLAIAAEKGLDCIDLWPLLVGPDGRIPAALTSDGLHYTAAAYERIGQKIEEAVARSAGGTVTPPPPPPTGSPVEVTASSLNVRATPNGAILGQVPRGTRLDSIGRDGEWVKVRWHGRDAWVHSAWVKPAGGIVSGLPGA
jgi:lysophospholipase L1-like esterase